MLNFHFWEITIFRQPEFLNDYRQRNIAYVTPDDLHLHKNCVSHNNGLEVTVWNIISGLFFTNDDFYVDSHLWQMFGKKYTTMYFIKNKSWLPYLQGLLSLTITCNKKV